MGAPRLSSTPLPGIGVRYDMTTRDRQPLSVVAHRDGDRTFSVYRRDDPDACALSVRLTAGEAAALVGALLPDHAGRRARSGRPRPGAYVLLLVVVGPLTARFTEPVATRLAARLRNPAAFPAAGTAERERTADQDTVARP